MEVETELLLSVDDALKQSPMPEDCLCPECGGRMTLTHDRDGSFYFCIDNPDCGDVEA